MKKLNIAEILKDCPKGTELYSPIFGECALKRVGDYLITVVCIKVLEHNFYSDGSYCTGGECLLFPSKENKDWDKFNLFKDGDIVATNSGMQMFIVKEQTLGHKGLCYFGYSFYDKSFFKTGFWRWNRLATEEEKQKLFDAIKVNGYKWNDETKTLEKLEKEKFDITTLKPFESKVLVREDKTDVWRPAFYGFFNQQNKRFYNINSSTWLMCIPYNEDTKHLTGTTNDCDEYYKNW